MILRNSKNSILRMPLKTVLFTLLIVAVTAFLYLGMNTWYSSAAMLKDCDENYTTIAVFEYIGEAYPDESVYDEAMRAEVEKIDFSRVAQNENVLAWAPSECSIGLIEGFRAHSSLVPYQRSCVLKVTDVYALDGEGIYYGYIEEAMYSYRTDMEGRHVYLYTDGFAFEPDGDSEYIVHGTVEDLNTTVQSVHFSAFYSRAATLAGVDCEAVEPYIRLDIQSDGRMEKLYRNIADYYQVMNNKVYVYSTPAVEDMEEFHQGWLSPLYGRLFTQQEQQSCAPVCIITETIARSCGLEVGDRVTVHTTRGTDQPAADCYWGADSMSSSDEYEIVGIVNYYEGLQYNVYIPARPTEAAPQSYIYILGQATLVNGTAERFKQEITPLLPERVSLNIYDQGYQSIADSLTVILSASVALTVIAAVAAVLILVCFAFLFVEKQRGAVETMRCFGMKKGEVRLYLLFGAGLIAFIACTVGALIGTRYAGALVDNAYKFISEMQAIDLRYSDGYLGLVREYDPIPLTSIGLAAAVAAAVFLLSLGLCLYFANRTIEGRVMQKRSRMQKLRPPKRSSVSGRGALRYSLLSIRRGGVRTLVVPVVSIAMMLFITTLISTSASYTRAREALCDSTEIPGYLVTLRGKYAGNLVVDSKYAQKLIDTGYIENATVAYHKCYGYLGIAERADGGAGDAKNVPEPINGFELTLELDKLAASPYLVFTNDASKAPEFFFNQYSAAYMPGYDENALQSTDWEQPVCMVSTQFMAENKIEYGDAIRVYVRNGTSYSSDERPFQYAGEEGEAEPSAPFLGIELKVVGSFLRQGSTEQIYCPLPNGVMDMDGLSPGEKPDYARYNMNGISRRYVKDLAHADMQTLFGVLLGESYVSSFSFTLKDARELAAFKDCMEQEGFSGPKQERSVRVAVMLRDSDFSRSISSISQRSKYMEILYPVLLALCCAVGLITAFLMVNSRREEIAIMRGMGARKLRIFFSFFLEQAILLVVGLALGGAVWALMGESELLLRIDVYIFAASYALGAAVSLTVMNFKKALAAISDRE